MKKRYVTKLIALAAAMALTFTACSSGSADSKPAEESAAAKETDAETEEAAEAADAAEADGQEAEAAEEAGDTAEAADAAAEEVPAEIPAEAEADVVSYLTGGTYTTDQEVAAIGDTTLTAGEVTYLAAYQYYSAAYYYKLYGATLNLDEQVEDGSTFAQYLFQYGRDGAARYLATMAKAKEMGVTLSADQEAQLATLVEDNILKAGENLWASATTDGLVNADEFSEEEQKAWKEEHGEPYFRHSMMYYATTPDGYSRFYEKNMYMAVLREKLFGEGGEYAMTDADKADRTQAYLEENGVLWARCILFSTQNVETDEAKAEIKANAEAALAELEGLTGEERENKFTELQTQYDSSGYTAGEVQKYTNTDSLVDGYYSGIQALKVGDVGMTDETDYGYFVLIREPDQVADLEEEIVADYETDKLSELVDQWIVDYDIKAEEFLPDVDLNSFFTTLGELQTTIDAVDAL